MKKENFIKISPWLWEIPKETRPFMRVPARIYVSEKMLNEAFKDATIEQLINSASLPGMEKYALAMPDTHEGYGVPIGFVGAMRKDSGVISPSAIGFDQNCGIRLLKSKHSHKKIASKIDSLASKIQSEVPSGLGKGRKIKLSGAEIDKILNEGAQILVKKGYGTAQDIENCESQGKMPQADASFVSTKAKDRGKDQVGTLGSGNHFLEIQKIEQIFDKELANSFGLFENQVVVMIHTGSRGLGHQNCTDYLQTTLRAMPKYKISVPDRQLACVPFESPEGQNFFKAMSAGANYAFANRQMISFYVRKSWKEIFGTEELTLLYDVAHNIAKIEKYIIEGKKTEVVVHRKGSTRAFPPGHPELPENYKKTGQPVLIPGTMGTASYILAGTEKSKEAWHTVCHGSGRMMSRHEAIRRFPGESVVKDLKNKGIYVKFSSFRGIAEEAPGAYKDVDEVIEVVENAGLAKKVARLVPLAVIKGE